MGLLNCSRERCHHVCVEEIEMGNQKLFSFAATDNNKRLKEGTKREMRVNTSFPIQKKTCRFAPTFCSRFVRCFARRGGRRFEATRECRGEIKSRLTHITTPHYHHTVNTSTWSGRTAGRTWAIARGLPLPSHRRRQELLGLVSSPFLHALIVFPLCSTQRKWTLPIHTA